MLKSGQQIEGKIIERTDKYVKIDFNGAPLTYFFDEISEINGEKAVSLTVDKKSISDDSSQLVGDIIYLKSGQKLLGKIWKESVDTVTIVTDAGLNMGIIPIPVSKRHIERLEKGAGREELIEDAAESLHFFQQGVEQQNLKNYAQALDSYKKVIELNPNFIAAYLNLGSVNRSLGKNNEAIAAYERALELDYPKVFSEKAYLALGNTYESLGQNDEARIHFKKAIEIDSNFATAYMGLGHVYMSEGKYAEAKENLEKALAIFSSEGNEGGVIMAKLLLGQLDN